MPYTVRSYLDEPPTAAELSDVLDRLGLQPWDIARTGEPRAAELGLADLPHERDTWIALLVANPVLIQRPILVTDDGRAVVGRSEPAVRSVLAQDGGSDPGKAGLAEPVDPVGPGSAANVPGAER